MYTYKLYGEGNGTPLQYSCLENPMDRGAWWAAVHGVTQSWTRLSYFTFTFHFHALEKEMATHSSVLAWRIPGTGEPGGLPSMESHRVRHNWSDLAPVHIMRKTCLASGNHRGLPSGTVTLDLKGKDLRSIVGREQSMYNQDLGRKNHDLFKKLKESQWGGGSKGKKKG